MVNNIKGFREKLKQYTPENMEKELPLLADLLDRHYKASASVDIERAYYITEYLKNSEIFYSPIPIKRAGAVSNYMSKRKVYFHDSNMLGGATTSKEIGAPLYPEFLGLAIWPELDTISGRKANPQFLSEEDADILNFEVFPYWMDKTILELVRKDEPEKQSLLEKMVLLTVSKSATLSHTTPCYEVVLKKGITGIIREAMDKKEKTLEDDKIAFYESVKIAMKGILAYADNISKKAIELAETEKDEAKRKNLIEISKICARVPANPASGYREAVNSLWICQVAVFAENSNMAINPGRIDQILYPYFIRDYNEGRLSIKDALEITGSLWFKLADNVNLVPEAAERLFGGAGAVPAVTLGGVDTEGKDAVNELTYLMLKVTELLPIRDPNVNARYFQEVNSLEYRDEVSRVVMSTRAIPAFFNDKENIDTLVNQGLTVEHARDYAVIGCVELGSAGRDYSSSSSIFMMLYTILYMALHNGKTPVTGDAQIGPASGDVSSFNSIEDLWKAYGEQYNWMAETAVYLNNVYGKKHQENLPTPLLSAFFEGPMEKGKDLIFGGATYNSSGITHIGFADVCDSISAIEDVCFSKNPEFNMTLKELVTVVDNNFKGHKGLRAYLQNDAPKYGTDNPIAVENSKRLIALHYNIFNDMKNYRGGNHRLAYWTMTNHAGYGTVAKALPNGRQAGKLLSSGITPVSQIKTQLTEALNSVACLDSKCIPGAYALNMKYSPIEISENTVHDFGNIVEGYFKNGGQQVQFNINDYETLMDAKAHSENYPRLLVRVSGYSANFKSLNEAMQDELITRSQYNLSTGRLVELRPLPESFADPE